jgi:hypothetical protein
VPALAEGVSIGDPLVRMMMSFVGFLFFSAFFLCGGRDSGVCTHRLYGVVVYWKIASASLLKKNMVRVCLERKEKLSRRSC